MSGDKMTINPDTGQPEAFAFLLPLLGGLTGAGIGAAGGLTGLGITSAIGGGALGTGLGKFAETGSLKQALLSGATSYLTAGMVDKFANAAAFPGLNDALSTVTDPLTSNIATDAVSNTAGMLGNISDFTNAAVPNFGGIATDAASNIATDAVSNTTAGMLGNISDFTGRAVPSFGGSATNISGMTSLGGVLDDAASNTIGGLGSAAFPAPAIESFGSAAFPAPAIESFGQSANFGLPSFDPVSALGRAAAGSFTAAAAYPEYPEFDDNRETYDIPEAAPPTRRLRRMPSDFAQNNRGEFRFFEDPAREKIGENARNFFPEGSTADRETKYAQYGGPVRMDLGGKIEPVTAGNAPKSFGGMMGQFDPQEVYDRGGKLPGIMGNFFGVSDLGKFSGLSDEEMLLLKEKKKARRMQEGGVLEEGIGSIPTDMVPSESVMDDDSMRSEVALEDSANVFNEGVQAIMCESAAPKEALTRFVEMYGMERLHEVICEVISIAQEGDDMEGTLTKENEDGTPVALKEGGSVDTIPASLEGKQSYLLAENEYIIPEPVVRAVGGGNVGAGADAFDRFIENVKAVA